MHHIERRLTPDSLHGDMDRPRLPKRIDMLLTPGSQGIILNVQTPEFDETAGRDLSLEIATG